MNEPNVKINLKGNGCLKTFLFLFFLLFYGSGTNINEFTICDDMKKHVVDMNVLKDYKVIYFYENGYGHLDPRDYGNGYYGRLVTSKRNTEHDALSGEWLLLNKYYQTEPRFVSTGFASDHFDIVLQQNDMLVFLSSTHLSKIFNIKSPLSSEDPGKLLREKFCVNRKYN